MYKRQVVQRFLFFFVVLFVTSCFENTKILDKRVSEIKMTTISKIDAAGAALAEQYPDSFVRWRAPTCVLLF